MPIAPLLAVDVGGLIAIAFMVISFIGWLSNLINGTQKPGQRPAQPQRPRPPQNKRLRDEIESFMRESQGQPRKPPETVLSADDVGASSTGTRQPAKPQSPQAKSNPQRQKPAKAAKGSPSSTTSAASSRRPPGQDVSQRHVGTTSLGQDLQQRVSQHMVERVGAIASRDVEPTVDDSVAAHFSPFSGDQPVAGALTDVAGVARRTTAAESLLKMLRDPQGVKQALVLSEVLTRPVALRPRAPR